MESAKRTYEILNSELHDELPALHDSRLLFTVTNMQTLFAAEEVFHTETAKVANTSAAEMSSSGSCSDRISGVQRTGGDHRQTGEGGAEGDDAEKGAAEAAAAEQSALVDHVQQHVDSAER